MLKVAEKIEKQMEHSGGKYIGDISHVEDIYEADSSDTNKASIIAVLEFEDKKILLPVIAQQRILLKLLISIIHRRSL